MDIIKRIELMKSDTAVAGSYSDGWNKAVETILVLLRADQPSKSMKYIDLVDVFEKECITDMDLNISPEWRAVRETFAAWLDRRTPGAQRAKANKRNLMFRIYHSKKFYIIDEFGKSIGSFNEKYYAELFVSLVNSQDTQSSVQADGVYCHGHNGIPLVFDGVCGKCGLPISPRRIKRVKS